jgi:hypothetical protein
MDGMDEMDEIDEIHHEKNMNKDWKIIIFSSMISSDKWK